MEDFKRELDERFGQYDWVNDFINDITFRYRQEEHGSGSQQPENENDEGEGDNEENPGTQEEQRQKLLQADGKIAWKKLSVIDEPYLETVSWNRLWCGCILTKS